MTQKLLRVSMKPRVGTRTVPEMYTLTGDGFFAAISAVAVRQLGAGDDTKGIRAIQSFYKALTDEEKKRLVDTHDVNGFLEGARDLQGVQRRGRREARG